MYVERPTTYEAIQWTGDNVQALANRFLDTVEDAFVSTKIESDGSLTFRFVYNNTFNIPADGWLVSAAGWGDGPRIMRWGVGQALTNEEFQDRFESV